MPERCTVPALDPPAPVTRRRALTFIAGPVHRFRNSWQYARRIEGKVRAYVREDQCLRSNISS
jgi:hypothetical protein